MAESGLYLPEEPAPGSGRLAGYLALGHWSPDRANLDPRLELLVSQLSADLSACHWCIERGRHLWRKARLSAVLLQQLGTYRTHSGFSERDRAALALAEAVARYTEGAPDSADEILVEARRYFTDAQIARIATLAAGEHFYDAATGAIGLDVRREQP